MHLACAQAHCAAAGAPLLPPVCKHWARRGACAFQARCFFRHPPEARAAPAAAAPPGAVRADAASRAAAWRAWNQAGAGAREPPGAAASATALPPEAAGLSGAGAGSAVSANAAPRPHAAAEPCDETPPPPRHAEATGTLRAAAARPPARRCGAARNDFRAGVFRRCGRPPCPNPCPAGCASTIFCVASRLACGPALPGQRAGLGAGWARPARPVAWSLAGSHRQREAPRPVAGSATGPRIRWVGSRAGRTTKSDGAAACPPACTPSDAAGGCWTRSGGARWRRARACWTWPAARARSRSSWST